MIDFAKITVKAGDGGRGSGSRAPISRKRYAKADGGDGGAGGNVIFEATNDARGLEPYRFEHFFKAQSGKMGLSNLRRGSSEDDLILKVPVGTVIKGRTGTQEIEGSKSTEASTNYFEYDLVNEGQQVLVARGGRGGKGNAHMRDEFGRRPRSGEPGEIGETWELTLELKLIADVGLIGLPNAGKSTLISKITSARPKIANYPFTTLEPNLGVLEGLLVIGNGSWGKENKTLKPNELSTINDQRIIIADIPGLIEGASEGKGLGHLFLRHIERTKILVHMIDITSGDLWGDYQTIRGELKRYSKELAKKKEIIVFNKIDLVDSELKNKALEVFKVHRKKVIAVSLEKGIGIEDLVSEMVKKLKF